MAIDLVARLRLKDELTSPLRRAASGMESAAQKTEKLSKSTEKLGDSMRYTQSKWSNAPSSFGRVGGSLKNLTGGVKGLIGGLVGLVAKFNPVTVGLTAIGTAAAGAYASVKLFNATVGEAAKMQQSEVIIGAMFDDAKLTKQYTQLLDRISIESPLFDSQAMYGNSKSFITTTKDIKQLEKMWSLTERLMASDPMQGLDGAVLALKELFSGDAVSIVERFELPRAVMNEIKELPLDKQLTKLDEYFNKIGLTTKLIKEMGGTAIGMWTQVKERFQLVMRQMGEPSLKAVSSFLSDALTKLEGPEVQRFAEWGGKVINQMISGLSTNANKLYEWFTQLTASPEFQSKSTLTGKINFIVEDIADRLRAWYDGGGRDKIISFGSDVAAVLVSAMDASDEVAALGVRLGESVWQGVIAGVKRSAAESPIAKYLNIAGTVWKYGNPTSGLFNAMKDMDKFNIDGSNYHGLDSVPYDGYVSKMHKGEKILSAQEAKEYREGKSGNSAPVINIAKMEVRQESDIKRIAHELANLLEGEALQIG